MKQFELTFEGLITDSADAVRKIKSILLAELNLGIPRVQEILEAPPKVIMTSWDESELRAYLEKLETAGALVHLSSDEESAAEETSEEEFELSLDLDDLSPAEPNEPKVWSLELPDSAEHEEFDEPALDEETASTFALSLDEDEKRDEDPSLELPSLNEEKDPLSFAKEERSHTPFDLSLALDEEDAESAPLKTSEQNESFSLSISLDEDPPPPPLEKPSTPPPSLALSLDDEEEVENEGTKEIETPILLHQEEQNVPKATSSSVKLEDGPAEPPVSPPPLSVESAAPPLQQAPSTSPEDETSRVSQDVKVEETKKRPSRFASLAIEAPPLTTDSEDSFIEPEESTGRPLRTILGVMICLLVGANYYYFSSLKPSHDPLHGLSYDDLVKSPRSAAPKVAMATALPIPPPPPRPTHSFEGTLEGVSYTLSMICHGDDKKIQTCSGTLTTVKPRDPRPEEIVQGITRAPWAERTEIGPVALSSNSDGSGDGEGPIRIYVDHKGGRERVVGRALLKVSGGEKPLLSLLLTNARSGENVAPNTPQLEYSQGGYHFRFAERVKLEGRIKDEIKRGDTEASPPAHQLTN